MKADSKTKTTKIKAALFLSGLTGMSIIGGFSYAVAATKKIDTQLNYHPKKLPNPGTSLALRALGWGSLYAVSGVTLFCYLIWKLSGARDLQEFRNKAGLILPKISNYDQKESRTEFDSLTDLFKHIIELDNYKKNEVLNFKNSQDKN